MYRIVVRSCAVRRRSRRAVVAVALALSALLGCGSDLRPAYAIKATVSSLKGSGLELWVNGHDPVPVDKDGEVTLGYMVGGYAYGVTVKTQPSNPTQTCIVANATGAMGSFDVNLTVTCSVNEYLVKGTIVGLKGSGLVLALSGRENLPVNGATFEFQTKVASGTQYAVTVATQPTSPTQFCSVSGSGTMGGSDVTNVAVVCSTDAFQVGGAVGGLAAGTKVVLQNNGNDDLEVTGSESPPVSFTFPKMVADGATYEVKVKTQPTNPWQTCIVPNGTGTIASAPVSTVSVACTINSYAIVVDVGGLSSKGTGTGLVLQNNGGDDLVVMGNGSHTFATHLVSGASYSVTVKIQPSGQVAQDCAVTDGGTGIVLGADVTHVVVTCANIIY